jgi:hypothetical protein
MGRRYRPPVEAALWAQTAPASSGNGDPVGKVSVNDSAE